MYHYNGFVNTIERNKHETKIYRNMRGGVNVRQFKKQYAISLMEGRIVRSERT